MSSKHIHESMNECYDIDQLIVNAAISHGITAKPMCTFWA